MSRLMNRTYSHPSPTPRDVRDPQNPFYQGVHQGKHWYLWHPDDMGGAKPMNELFWFEAFQSLLLRVVNSGYGRQLMGIDTELPEIVLITKSAIHYRLGENEYQAQFYVGAKFANVIRYRWPEFKRYARFFYDMPNFFTLLNMNGVAVPAHATSTHYPAPSTGSSTVDGSTYRNGVYEALSTKRAGAGNSGNATDDEIRAELGRGAATNYRNMARGHFCFDTSSLPDGLDVITAATVSLYLKATIGVVTKNTTSAMTACHIDSPSGQASASALVAADFNIGNWEDTTYAEIAGGSLAMAQYNVFTLSSAGRALITKTGITYLGSRIGNDVDTGPEIQFQNDDSTIGTDARSADYTGTTRDPKLTVTYFSYLFAKLNVLANSAVAAFNSIATGSIAALNGIALLGAPPSHVLLGTATASSSATLAFEGVMDDTYDIYEFHFINMHPSEISNFGFQCNAVGASGYNEEIMSQTSRLLHEADSSRSASVHAYWTDGDSDYGTGYQTLSHSTSDANSSNVCGVLTTFAFGRNTTLFKQWYAKTQSLHDVNGHPNSYNTGAHLQVLASGNFPITAKIDDISFNFSSGTIASGVIKMYGIIIS
jgi:hypothetical protein